MAVGAKRLAERTDLLPWAALALFLAQLTHGLTPADTESDSLVGPIAGAILLIANLTAIVGLRLGRAWAVPLAGWTSLLVALGFILYHSLPFHSAVTNPYFGEGVGVLPWLTVILAIATGLWTASLVFGRTITRG